MKNSLSKDEELHTADGIQVVQALPGANQEPASRGLASGALQVESSGH